MHSPANPAVASVGKITWLWEFSLDCGHRVLASAPPGPENAPPVPKCYFCDPPEKTRVAQEDIPELLDSAQQKQALYERRRKMKE